MPHSKGQLAGTYLVESASGFFCVETGQQRMFGDSKSYNKGLKLHLRVCEACRNADFGKDPKNVDDKDVMKEMIKKKRYGMKTTSDGLHY